MFLQFLSAGMEYQYVRIQNIQNIYRDDEGRASRGNICLFKSWWQDFEAGGTRNRNRRRKNMSGIPGMGQRWQSVLKIRVIMIPQPENTAAGAASGVCRSMEGSCGASGSHAGRSLHIPSRTGGRENNKSMAGKHQIKGYIGPDRRYCFRCNTALGWFY